MIQTTQIQERLQTQSFNNLPNSLRFLISSQGKYLWLEPHCLHCGSNKVVKNGWYRCEQELILNLKLDIKQGHYLCKSCNLTFSTPLPQLKEFQSKIKQFLQETCFSLYTSGMSFYKISSFISEHYNIPLSDESARKYYIQITTRYRNRKELTSSGYFYLDCQHEKVSGEHYARLALRDIITGKCIIDEAIPEETNKEILDRIRLLLLPYKVKGFVVDGKIGLIEALRKEYKVNVQLCIFHVQKLILKQYGKKPSLLELRNLYMLLNILVNHDLEVQFINSLLARKTIQQDEKYLLEEFYRFRKSLKKYRRKQKKYLLQRTEEEMLEKLKEAKKFLCEKHEIKRIKKIEKQWEELTAFLHDSKLKPTNNGIEQYFSKTLTKTDKKRFRTIKALKTRIAAQKAVFNKWFKPSISLQEIMQKYAQLFLLFSA